MDGLVIGFLFMLLLVNFIRLGKSIHLSRYFAYFLIVVCLGWTFINIYFVIYEGRDFEITEDEQNMPVAESSYGVFKNKKYDEDSNPEENTVYQETLVIKLKSYLEERAFEVMGTVIVALLLIVLANLIYRHNYIKIYKRKLNEKLFNINHLWLERRNLIDIIVSMNISSNGSTKTMDLCKYFIECFKSNSKDIFWILGNAGEGKTVSLHRLSKELLDNNQNYHLNLFRKKSVSEPIPVILEFSALRDITSEEDFFNKIIENINYVIGPRYLWGILGIFEKHIQDRIRADIDAGHYILMIDGYDEIDELAQIQIANIIASFSKRYEKCWIILTSRTVTYESKRYIITPEEKRLFLSPFNKEQVQEFLSKWQFENDKNQWELYEKIENNHHLERLAENPLLLTLIAYLYEKSELQVTYTMKEFYQNAMDCLLDTWEYQKRIFRRNRISLEAKKFALENIAFEVYQKGRQVLKLEEIINQVQPVAFRFDERAKEIVSEIINNSGILEEKYSGNYQFLHRSFFEYYLACYLLREQIDIMPFINESTQYSNVLFFYFSDSSDKKKLHEYIIMNLENDAIIEPLLTDCIIEDLDLLEKYVNQKIESKNINNYRFYQILGNLGHKFEFLQDKISEYLLKELNKIWTQDKINEDLQAHTSNLIYDLSYFKDGLFIVNMIMHYHKYINFESLAIKPGYHLEHILSDVFFLDIPEICREQMVRGFQQSGKYIANYKLLARKNEVTDQMRSLIFRYFILSTQNECFVSWLDIYSLAEVVPLEVLEIAHGWIKKYGWKWDKHEKFQLENRYILAYYFLCANWENEYDHISNRLKFISTYFKNDMSKNSRAINYYVDLADYQVKTVSEFRFHWEKRNSIKDFSFNPVLLRYAQIIAFFLCMFVVSFFIVYYSNRFQKGVRKEIGMPSNLVVEVKNSMYYHWIIARYQNIISSGCFTVSKYFKPNSRFFCFGHAGSSRYMKIYSL